MPCDRGMAQSELMQTAGVVSNAEVERRLRCVEKCHLERLLTGGSTQLRTGPPNRYN
jgi:hypothetical protein